LTHAGIAVVAFVAGACLRGLWPPFVLDDPFWRAFWSGPPVAGLFAVAAAAVAFYPAFQSTRIVRENAARDQWWKRAEWALGLAGSDTHADREVASDALTALSGGATDVEGKMIFRTLAILQDRERVDTPARPAGKRRSRFFR
jgi:hypothetical protein